MKEGRRAWRKVIIFANILIIILIILICFTYVKSFRLKRNEDIRYTFTNMVSAMRKTAGGYLISHQQSCNDWAGYINSHDMETDEAMYFLRSANSIDGVMAHVIEYDTLKGYSTDMNDEGSYEVDYSSHRDDFSDVIELLKSGKSEIFITHAYTNPVDGSEVIGFCCNVEMTSDHSSILIRTVPLSMITENWVFPSDFEDAEISLINRKGDYIIRSKSLRGENIWEYVSEYNDVSVSEKEELIESVRSNEITFSEFDTEKGAGYFVIQPTINYGNWYYVGYVPVDSIDDNSVDFNMVIIVSIGSAVLMLMNCFYFFSVNRQLRENAEEIYKANQAKTRFLSSMSHDIRTPMNAIIGITTLSEKHVDDPVYIGESLRKITLASNHLLTLINDILDISKVESGKLQMNPSVFSIVESMNNLVNIVHPQIKEKEQHFNIRTKDITHEYLLADELRLNQIFINLLTNAVKYTNNGGTINIDLAETPVDDGKSVILSYTVEDNGIGMTEEFQKNMYETFSRAKDTRIDKIQGSGLGLAITKQIVDLMGGEIECRSELGKGTVFTVRVKLPVSETGSEDISLPPMDILVVDDDEIFLEMAQDVLKSLGAEAEIAHDGFSAIDMVCERFSKNDSYPVIIVDWKMPEINGIETVKKIREKTGDKTTVIIMSSYDWTEIEEEAIKIGVNGFINKPFFRSSVYAKIAEILDISDVSEMPLYNVNSYEDFAGLHLLVAEDNDLNWEIISEILEEYGITSERAENGHIAVDKITADDSFDGILMDIQMPVMNGRDATRKIRSSDDERLKKVPIIAMTADAFAEDVQACIESGMDGHIPKPVDIKKIFNEFQKVGLRRK